MARSPRTVHVVPHGDGWAIRAASGRASKTYSTRADAVKAAQATVRDGGGQLIVRAKNGQIQKSFTLGRAAMEKLNAVEGVVLTPAVKKVFKDFDREGVTPVQRRAQLRRKIGKLASPQKVVGKGARQPPTSSKG